MNKQSLAGISGCIGAFIVYLIGNFDIPFKCLLILMCCDIIIGVVDCIFFNVSKYGNGFSSNGLMQGAIRKGLMLAIVVIASQLDILMNLSVIRASSIMYLIACEGISIIENLIKIGVPCPKFLKNILEETKEEANKVD